MKTQEKIQLLTKLIEAIQRNNDKEDIQEEIAALRNHLNEKDAEQTLNAIIHSLSLQEVFEVFSHTEKENVKQIAEGNIDYTKKSFYKGWY